jgi:hypothetical protein
MQVCKTFHGAAAPEVSTARFPGRLIKKAKKLQLCAPVPSLIITVPRVMLVRWVYSKCNVGHHQPTTTSQPATTQCMLANNVVNEAQHAIMKPHMP